MQQMKESIKKDPRPAVWECYSAFLMHYNARSVYVRRGLEERIYN